MGKKIRYILVILCVALAFIGILTYALMAEGNKLLENTTIDVKGDTTTTLKAEIDNLYPGSVNEYAIHLNGDQADEFYVTLSFNESLIKKLFGGNKLKDYIAVKVVCGTQTIEKPLKDLIDGKEKISLGQNASEIKIIYTMDLDAGNDTQGASVDFSVKLTIKRISG